MGRQLEQAPIAHDVKGWAEIGLDPISGADRKKSWSSVSGSVKPVRRTLSALEVRVVQSVGVGRDARKICIVRRGDYDGKAGTIGRYAAELPVAEQLRSDAVS